MEPQVSRSVEFAAAGIEALATALIVGFIAFGSLRFLYGSLTRKRTPHQEYELFRQRLGRAMLLGLEIMVAADVVRTVASGATLASIIPLGLLVVMRTFLTWALIVEMEGRWPWQPRPRSSELPRRNPDQQPEADPRE